MKVYWAAPLFTSAERAFNRRCAHFLRGRGHEVWLPQENEPSSASPRAIFEADKAGIDQSDVVVACLDGADPDSGTCWECGYAYGKKPVVVFRTDYRTENDAGRCPCNIMLWASATATMLAPWREEGLDSFLHELDGKIRSVCSVRLDEAQGEKRPGCSSTDRVPTRRNRMETNDEMTARINAEKRQRDAAALTVDALIVELQKVQSAGHGSAICYCAGCDCYGRCGSVSIRGDGTVGLERVD